MNIADHKDNFIRAMHGIPTHHVVAAMNAATSGINWTGCSKSHMADRYAQVMCEMRFSLSSTANTAMRAIDLQELRRAAIERSLKNPDWSKAIEVTMRAAINSITATKGQP